jgi:ribosomal protein S27AE
MKNLKRERYYTMNSWNNATAPAYNLKVYNVIDDDLQDKVFKLMEADNFYDEINFLIEEFSKENDYVYQAGFNGKSGGYLVLYNGGKKKSEYKSICLNCGQKNFTSTKETGNACGKCGENERIDRDFFEIFTMPGQSIEENEAPTEVLKRFRKLAIDIIKTTEAMARDCKVKKEEYQVIKTRKVLTRKVLV